MRWITNIRNGQHGNKESVEVELGLVEGRNVPSVGLLEVPGQSGGRIEQYHGLGYYL